MTKTNAHKLISWLLVFVWMVLIFYLSHQPADASSKLSSGMVQIIVGMIEAVLPYITFDTETLHFFIRKGAHLFAYSMLGLLMLYALLLSKLTDFYAAGLAFGGSVVYAISDEIHQLFIPGRSGEVRDVIIDSVGVLIGIGVYFLLRWTVQRFFLKV